MFFDSSTEHTPQRSSKNFIDGVIVAQAEYDREWKARRDAEAEITRLRVLLSGQAAKLTAMSGEDRRRELRQQMSKELNDNLSGLEHDLSRLKLERDITLAEMEELSSTKRYAILPSSNVLLISHSFSFQPDVRETCSKPWTVSDETSRRSQEAISRGPEFARRGARDA